LEVGNDVEEFGFWRNLVDKETIIVARDRKVIDTVGAPGGEESEVGWIFDGDRVPESRKTRPIRSSACCAPVVINTFSTETP
jgi:hypothetical protein